MTLACSAVKLMYLFGTLGSKHEAEQAILEPIAGEVTAKNS
jgi:hypothetical protein